MNDYQWAEQVALKLHKKALAVAQRNRHKIPYTAREGVFDDCSGKERISWWTNGFWAGELWLLYKAFGSEIYRETAQEIEEKLDANLMDSMGMDHDSGFKWLLSAVADYRITGNEKAKNRGLLAAGNLAGRLNLRSGLIRAWNDLGTGERAGWAIIDCMMNLPLLYWASEVTKDPRFAQVAVSHADTAIRAFIRVDGSARHIVCFEPHSGKLIGSLGGQGMHRDSSWSRGQGWALYGFTLSYLHTGRMEYLTCAEHVADYVLGELSRWKRVPVDYHQEKDAPWEDTSAAAITACGLLELEGRTSEERGRACHETAVWLLNTLATERCLWDERVDPILEGGCVSYEERNSSMPLIYGDYYFTEAILRLCRRDISPVL